MFQLFFGYCRMAHVTLFPNKKSYWPAKG